MEMIDIKAESIHLGIWIVLIELTSVAVEILDGIQPGKLVPLGCAYDLAVLRKLDGS